MMFELYRLTNIETSIQTIVIAVVLFIDAVLCQIYVSQNNLKTLWRNIINVIIVVLMMLSVSMFTVHYIGICNMLEALKYEKNEQITAKYENTVTQTQYISNVDTVSLSIGETLICEIYSTDMQRILTATDFILSDGLTGEKQVVCDNGKYILTLYNVTQSGKVGIIDSSWTLSVNVVDTPISQEVRLQCVTSDANVLVGGTITVTAQYVYQNKYIANQLGTDTLDEQDIVLHNMVGAVTIQKANETGVYYIVIKDVGKIEEAEPSYIEIMNNTVIDSVGVGCNGITIDIFIEE